MWRLAEDTLSNDDLDALADWLRTYPRLTQGELVAEFEQAWAHWLGVKESVYVSSGTTANFALVTVAAQRIDRRPRVGVAAVTWATNVTPSLLLGHDVTIFDVDARTLGVDTSRVCAAMDQGAIDILFVTHLLGLNALTDEMVASADRNGVLLLEDCCESHGARAGTRMVGTSGLGSTFSFYYGHHMSTIEGGMVCTDDAQLADRIRLMRAHGLARESRDFDDYTRRYSDLDERFLFLEPGLNFRSSDLNAFLGLRQLPLLDRRIAQRNENLKTFLAQAPPYVRTDYNTEGASSFALPLVGVDKRGADAIRAVVDALQIESRPVVAGNLARQPFLKGFDVRLDNALPVADHIHDYGIYVGNGHHVDPAMVSQLTDALWAAGGEA